MLDLAAVHLADLAEALEDHSEETEWWLDRNTGEVIPWVAELDDLHVLGDENPRARGWVLVTPRPSKESYRDMEDFIDFVNDRQAADLLRAAIAGRGAFRRFRDTLVEFPELRTGWFEFHRLRMERRAIQWLVEEGLVDNRSAALALAVRTDSPVDAKGRLDAEALARAVARDLRKLYGDRLHEVVLFGSRARPDAHPDSDLDLVAVLSSMDSAWDELRHMDAVLWHHTLESGVTVSALPVALERWWSPDRPILLSAKAEGHNVG